MKRPAMKPLADIEIDQLLARNRLSGAQYDEIERRVLKQVVPKRRSRFWLLLTPATALASLLAIWLLVPPPAATPPSAGFTPKAAGPTVLGLVDVGCAGDTPHVCRLGDTLMFSVGAGTTAGHLAAYAERVDDPAADPIWYFPSPSGAMPRVEASSVTRVLPDGIRLAEPHAPGRYRIRAWISATPIERARLRADSPSALAGIMVDIVDGH